MIRLLDCPVCKNKPKLGVICDKNSIYYSCEGENHKIIISGNDNNEARKNWNNFVSNVSEISKGLQMIKIGQLSIGKIGFDIGFDHDIMRKYHGNFDLYANVDTSDNSDYAAALEIMREYVNCNGVQGKIIDVVKWMKERLNSQK